MKTPVSLFAPDETVNLSPTWSLQHSDMRGVGRPKKNQDAELYQAPPLPQRAKGELRTEKIALCAGAEVDVAICPAFSFWPDAWRIEAEEMPAGALFLRKLVLGSRRIYPVQAIKPTMISRAQGEAFSKEQRRHQEEGITVEEAMRHSLAGRFLPPDYAAMIWTFENKSDRDIDFVFVMEGLEIA